MQIYHNPRHYRLGLGRRLTVAFFLDVDCHRPRSPRKQTRDFRPARAGGGRHVGYRGRVSTAQLTRRQPGAGATGWRGLTLRGHVRSWGESDEAEVAAYNALGVRMVHNCSPSATTDPSHSCDDGGIQHGGAQHLGAVRATRTEHHAAARVGPAPASARPPGRRRGPAAGSVAGEDPEGPRVRRDAGPVPGQVFRRSRAPAARRAPAQSRYPASTRPWPAPCPPR